MLKKYVFRIPEYVFGIQNIIRILCILNSLNYYILKIEN